MKDECAERLKRLLTFQSRVWANYETQILISCRKYSIKMIKKHYGIDKRYNLGDLADVLKGNLAAWD